MVNLVTLFLFPLEFGLRSHFLDADRAARVPIYFVDFGPLPPTVHIDLHYRVPILPRKLPLPTRVSCPPPYEDFPWIILEFKMAWVRISILCGQLI